MANSKGFVCRIQSVSRERERERNTVGVGSEEGGGGGRIYCMKDVDYMHTYV